MRWWDGGRWTERLDAAAPAPVRPAAPTVATATQAPTAPLSPAPAAEVDGPDADPAPRTGPDRRLVTAGAAVAAGAVLFVAGYVTGSATATPSAAAAPDAAAGPTRSASSTPTPAAPVPSATATPGPVAAPAPTTAADPAPVAPAAPAAPPPPAAAPVTVQLAGTFTVVGFYQQGQVTATVQIAPDGSSCGGINGYGDVGEGTTVTVYDAAGTIVGTTTLGAGTGERRYTDEESRVAYPDLYYGPCALPFALTVPDSEFYQVEVSHRGRTTVQRADAGSVAMQLGS